jgi:8-oxo-dGTP pyrophosphatase MutT (NUDIX family)
MMQRKAYQQSLPKKRMSAGCLFFDNRGRLLVVNPTYKETWEIPGGENESPREAAIREAAEELGLVCRLERLLCVDYKSETETSIESVQFIFLGSVLSAEMISRIRLPREELSEFRLLAPEKAVKLLNKKLRRRVRHCLKALERPVTLYLEEQQVVFNT